MGKIIEPTNKSFDETLSYTIIDYLSCLPALFFNLDYSWIWIKDQFV